MCELRAHVVSGSSSRSGVYEVQHLGGGTGHAALFSGERLSSLFSCCSPSILPSCLSVVVFTLPLMEGLYQLLVFLIKLIGCPDDEIKGILTEK